MNTNNEMCISQQSSKSLRHCKLIRRVGNVAALLSPRGNVEAVGVGANQRLVAKAWAWLEPDSVTEHRVKYCAGAPQYVAYGLMLYQN
jgi:hypothetical protein